MARKNPRILGRAMKSAPGGCVALEGWADRGNDRAVNIRRPTRLEDLDLSKKKEREPLEAHQLFICSRSMKREGDKWVWCRGKAREALLVEVEIFPIFPTDPQRPAFKVMIYVGGELVAADQKPTEERAAAWASKKLYAIMNAIGGCR